MSKAKQTAAEIRTAALMGAINKVEKAEKVKTVKVASKKKDLAAVAKESSAKHGDRGDYIKATITLPPDVYMEINAEVARRKVNKLGNPSVSAVIREAIGEYLNK